MNKQVLEEFEYRLGELQQEVENLKKQDGNFELTKDELLQEIKSIREEGKRIIKDLRTLYSWGVIEIKEKTLYHGKLNNEIMKPLMDWFVELDEE